MEFWQSVGAAILGTAVPAILSVIAVRVFDHLRMPKRTADDLASLKIEMLAALASSDKKIDGLAASYAEVNQANKKSQYVLFTVQDLQFAIMAKSAQAMRELAESVCNGNKESALKCLDEAEKLSVQGQDIQKDFLMEKL